MSSGGALPQALSSSSSFVGHHQISGFPLFGQLTAHRHHHHHQQQPLPFQQQQLPPSTTVINSNTYPQHRIKLKRQRQRVDAGEPRNSYQATRSPMLQQQRFTNDFQFNSNSATNASSGNNVVTLTTTNSSNDNVTTTLNSIFPWITTTAATMHQRPESSSNILEQTSDVDDPVQDLSQRNTDSDEQQEFIGSCKAATHIDALETSKFRDETTITNSSCDNDDEETTTMIDDQCTPNVDRKIRDDDEIALCRKDESRLERAVSETSPTPSASFVGGGSSSRRKNALPQRQPVDVEQESTPQIEQSDLVGEESVSNDVLEQQPETKMLDDAPKNVLAASLAANINPQNRIQEMIDMQRRIYTNWIDQQKKLLGANDEEQKRAQIQLIQQQIQRDYAKLAQSLKQELISGLNSSVDKIIAEFIAAEAAASAQRTSAALAEQQREQAAAAAVNRNPFLFHPLYHSFNGQSTPFPNPFMQNTLPPPAPPHPSGIFPSASAPHTTFNPFVPHLKAASPATPTLRKTDDLSPFVPRKKRSKVTDCTRISKVQAATASNREASSLPDSARSSPQLSYFPPTMVGHPLYGGGTFGADDRDSPVNSDDASDCGPYDGSVGGSSTLTPMHLRKAKLMFFYTRYPNSALLKSYFPDIRFNKNNTAQLVKWFSNFREFFYNQMDKYARNYLAEGVKNKEDIIVTPDSEIYKNLNQHYNRNNHIQPPDRLALVIQETLREFFSAVQSGRDAEPSWKKTIYKVINRMDDPIPEYFKDPNFLERLEG